MARFGCWPAQNEPVHVPSQKTEAKHALIIGARDIGETAQDIHISSFNFHQQVTQPIAYHARLEKT